MTTSPQEDFLDDLARRYSQEGDRFSLTRDGSIIASMDLVQDEEAIEIKLIMVQPALRSRGIGTGMLADVAELADTHGITILLCVMPLDATCENRLVRLYAGAGFEVAPELCRGNDLVLARHPVAEPEYEPAF